MKPEVTIEDSRLSIHMETLVRAMTKEQKLEVLSWIASEDDVLNHVVDVICGEDPLGWSTGDPNRRAEILSRIEGAQLKEGVRYNWKPWEVLHQTLKNIRAEEHLSWVLYHQIDADVSRRVFDELCRLGVKDNYTSEKAEQDITTIKTLIESTFAAMKEVKP
jgi:hypothetical protein